MIQNHLKKLFQGLYKVEFSEKKDKIVAMFSGSGEKVILEEPVDVTDAVEEWLGALSSQMQNTLRVQLAKCVKSGSDYNEFPSQVLCLAEQIRFTTNVEDAIGGGTLHELKSSLKDTLRELTSFELSKEPLMQLKVKALVLDLVHHIDVVEQLEKNRCRGLNDWIWQKQLRFYLKQGSCVIRMNNAEFDYTYEYQGNAAKLVYTPLTDKCYLTLTQGMHMGFGGNPYGPAGTGKTESVKALGGQFGRQVLVFNCDEGIDFQSMGRIFIGLVKCGAWGCFDEFNRLKEDQLSAISQQIQVIQDAIKERQPFIKLLSRDINVDFNAGIFVTLNPAGKGYGGRSKLPDNLKALFRPVAMGRPDNNLIAEVILYSEGFSQAKEIASKVVSLYTLSKQLLSPQQHYDWGLRALKAVLNTGGKLLQAAKKENTDKLTASEECEVLIKAVRINTLSKLTYNDSTKFLSLIGDVFPGIESTDICGGELEKVIRQVMEEKPFSLKVDETQIRKMLQLKESLDQRMGCVVVGPSGSGKSTVRRVLQNAMIKSGQMVKIYVMNPKSMPRQQLLGHMDLDTREWADGVLTDAARQVVKEPVDVRSWIICDGDVDPEWIESLNSVLDDNHLLTLPNGERINFGSNVNFLFETHDLRYASPATISRMGMIFLSDEDTDIHRIVQKWLNEQPEDAKDKLDNWIEEIFYKAVHFVLQNYDMVVETTTVGTVMNGLSHVASATTKSEFVCALIRGLGGNLDISARTAFAKEMFVLANERPPDLGTPLDCYSEGSTYFVYETQRDTYGSHDGKLDKNDLREGAVVPTISVQRTLHMIQPWVDQLQPFILVGPEGCGKNMVIRHAFSQLKSTSMTVLHCNAQTTAEHVIQRISQACSLFSTNSGRVYRPRDSERLVLYLKDINLPKPDAYNTCMLIAFLQQLITFQGFYDQNLEFLGVERVQIVASMNAATTVGRHPLSTRFTAIVRVAYVDYPTADELTAVYSTFLEATIMSVPNCDAQWKDKSNREKLAGSMVNIYEQLKAKFSIDEHRHYLFTPRDLTKWTLGLLRYDLAQEALLDIWTYEARRLFRDRLVDASSQGKFDAIVNGLVRQLWKYSPNLDDIYFSSLGGTANAKQPNEGDSTPEETQLQRLDGTEFQQVVSHGINMYEREEKELHMLLFDEILEHIASVDRVLSEPGGSLLLVGRSGVGRRTATTLVAHMGGYKWFAPSITRDYSAKAFSADIKSVLSTAGVEGQHTVLYLEDHQCVEDAILEITNSLLSSGEVPGLYTHEELEPMLSPLKEEMMECGTQYRTVYEFFVSRVQQYLHIVIGMDSRNPKFLVRCESNPALYTRCTIVWMGEWKTKSLTKIPQMLLRETDLLENENADELMDCIIGIYSSCKERGATPREYISFLQTWSILHAEKSKELAQELSHLTGGLNKLEEASETVDDLSKSAGIKQRELAEAQVAADEAMDEITNALAQAKNNRKEVEELKIDLAKAEVETQKRKDDIEEELSSITPLLQSAKEAVGMIKSDNLNEIRSLKMPPEPIHDVLSAVLMLLGIQDTSWQSMKKFLGNRGVKEEILNFDAHRVTPDIRKSVLKLLKTKGSSFDNDTIYRVSVAAAPLASWVKANVKYSMVLEKIEPLEDDLAEAKHALESSQARLQQCESELKEIDDKVAVMKVQFSEKTKEAERLRSGLERAQETLDKAQGLLGQLGGEKKRWSEEASDLKSQLETLPTKILMATGFTAFLGQTSEDVRKEILGEWQDLFNLSTSFNYTRLMSTESELLTWKAMGLPSDNLSKENALVVNYSRERCPFIIDPANACSTWLQAFLALDETRPLSVIASQDQRFVNQVEQAVRFGKTLVILEVDGVEPYLYPLIRKDLCHQGPRWVVELGDKVIDYNENFRLYLVTRNPSPDLPPDAKSIVSEVNFTVTRSGLEGQLLGTTIEHEQPKLEKQKSELLKQEEDFKVQLAGLEKQLLEALATSEGDILENTVLIESLTKTKSTSADIEQALEKSAEKSLELDEQRDTYRPFAKDGSQLFFLVKELNAINHMYRFSLDSFISLFRETLGAPMTNTTGVKDRLQRLTPILATKVLYYVGRSLFKMDRPMFGLHLVHGMYGDQNFEDKEWQLFLGELVSAKAEQDEGQEGGSSRGREPRGFPTWASSDRYDGFRHLQEAVPRLIERASLDSPDLWTRWSRSPECETEFPAKVNKSITPFQKVLLVQAFRPDRLYSAIQGFVCEIMNVDSISPPPLDLNALYEETSEILPVLILTTPGADPSQELEELACRTNGVGKQRYTEIAMGGGQQKRAIDALRAAATEGEWLCLQNLHLVVSWLPVLEKELNTILGGKDDGPRANKRFRLWLTSEAHDQFPLILLQQCIKVTFESPPGVKNNIQRTYAQWGDSFTTSEDNAVALEQLLFILAWYHALSQERRTYVPQGWSKFYEFSSGDLRAGANIVKLVCDKSSGGSIEWESLHGLMENAVYGGRVDNPYDIRVLQAYLRRYFNDKVLEGRQALVSKLTLPTSSKRSTYVRLVEELPNIDPPSLFGLPENIERSLQRVRSSAVIKQLRALSSSTTGAEKFDREKWRAQLGPILETWSKLMPASRRKELQSNTGNSSPINDFVFMEASNATMIAESVSTMLAGVKRVVYGTGLLTPVIQRVASALLVGNVPDEWMDQWEGPENLYAWLRALAHRKTALMEWCEWALDDAVLQRPLQLSDLLHPGTFLNALRQQTARDIQCSIDSLQLVTGWSKKDLPSDIQCHVELTGTLLQGAAFDNGTLSEAASDMKELVTVPSIFLGYTPETKKLDKSHRFPLYFNCSRERLLAEISIPLPDDAMADQWIMAGVGFFLAED